MLSAPTKEQAKSGHQLILLNLFQLRQAAAGYPLLRAYREDIAGFAVGSVVTAALVILGWLIFHI